MYFEFFHEELTNSSIYLSINLILPLSRRWLMSFDGVVKSTFINKNKGDNVPNGCPWEKQLKFVYTDYLDVVVLMGVDSRSDPHIMILKA